MEQFDHITQRRNSKGEIVQNTFYRRICKEGITYYERPAGSGQYMYENLQPCDANGKAIVAKPEPIVAKPIVVEAPKIEAQAKPPSKPFEQGK